MAPKAKPKAKGAAEAKGAGAAHPKAASAKSSAKAKASPGAPAAGSGAAAVKQARADADAAEAPAGLKEPAPSTAAAAAADTADETSAAAIAGSPEPKPKAGPEEPPKPEPASREAAGSDSASKEEGKKSENPGQEAVDEKVEEQDFVDLSAIPDPWAEVADDVAMTRIAEEAWEVVALDGAEPNGPAHLALPPDSTSRLRPLPAFRRWLVSADLSGNSVECAADAGGPLWLRALSLVNNPVRALDGLSDAFPRLLSLDLSFVDIPSIDGAWSALRACARLRRIAAEGAGISSFEDVELMPQLRVLELVGNDIEDLAELKVLASKCASLEELDLRENDVITESGYLKKVKALFPKLQSLDNESQKVYKAKGRAEAYGCTVESKVFGEVAAVDGMFKNESCSCLEGNPCVTQYTCKDWPNREKVAAEARKKKGLRDDYGKLCD